MRIQYHRHASVVISSFLRLSISAGFLDFWISRYLDFSIGHSCPNQFVIRCWNRVSEPPMTPADRQAPAVIHDSRHIGPYSVFRFPSPSPAFLDREQDSRIPGMEMGDHVISSASLEDVVMEVEVETEMESFREKDNRNYLLRTLSTAMQRTKCRMQDAECRMQNAERSIFNAKALFQESRVWALKSWESEYSARLQCLIPEPNHHRTSSQVSCIYQCIMLQTTESRSFFCAEDG